MGELHHHPHMPGTSCGRHGLRWQIGPNRSSSDWPRLGHPVLWVAIFRERLSFGEVWDATLTLSGASSWVSEKAQLNANPVSLGEGWWLITQAITKWNIEPRGPRCPHSILPASAPFNFCNQDQSSQVARLPTAAEQWDAETEEAMEPSHSQTANSTSKPKVMSFFPLWKHEGTQPARTPAIWVAHLEEESTDKEEGTSGRTHLQWRRQADLMELAEFYNSSRGLVPALNAQRKDWRSSPGPIISPPWMGATGIQVIRDVTIPCLCCRSISCGQEWPISCGSLLSPVHVACNMRAICPKCLYNQLWPLLWWTSCM